MRAVAHATSVGRRAATTAVLGGFASQLVKQWGDPNSKMAGLEGALLGAGNPLLDISAVVDQPLLDKYGVSVEHSCLSQCACSGPAPRRMFAT